MSTGLTGTVFLSCKDTDPFFFVTLPKAGICIKGVAGGGGGWGACDPPPPFVSLFLWKQPTMFRGENAMTIMFDTV